MKQQCEIEASTHTEVYLKTHTFMHAEMQKLFLILTTTLSWQKYADSLMGFPLFVTSCSLANFRILSLSLIFHFNSNKSWCGVL